MKITPTYQKNLQLHLIEIRYLEIRLTYFSFATWRVYFFNKYIWFTWVKNNIGVVYCLKGKKEGTFLESNFFSLFHSLSISFVLKLGVQKTGLYKGNENIKYIMNMYFFWYSPQLSAIFTSPCFIAPLNLCTYSFSAFHQHWSRL